MTPYHDEEENLPNEIYDPLISRGGGGGLLTELEAPYVSEAERLEAWESNSARRFDIVKLPDIGGGIINSIINMSNSIIGAGASWEKYRADSRYYWIALCV